MKKVKKCFLTLFVLILIVFLWLFYRSQVQKKEGAAAEKETVSQVKKDEERVNYLNETAFEGNIDADMVVFDFPFQKSKDYVMNKEFIQQLKDTDIENLQDTARGYLEMIYGSSFREIMADEEGYVDTMADMFAGSYLIIGEEEVSVREYAREIAKWYADNHVKFEVDVKTAPCLIWKDQYIYVRTDVAATLYSCENTDYFEELTGYPIEVGETKKLVCDLALADTGEGYQLIGSQVISQYE